jgi:hypothetical protein
VQHESPRLESYDGLLARLGFGLVVTGLLVFIILFGLASRGVLEEVVSQAAQPAPTAPSAPAESRAESPKTNPERKPLPTALEHLDEADAEAAVKPKGTPVLTKQAAASGYPDGRQRVVWGARMVLLPSFAVLGSLFFVCGSLRQKRSNEEKLDDPRDGEGFSAEKFWSGFWYRMGEGILFAIVAFLASYAGFLDQGNATTWSRLLLPLGLLMAMFVKPAEQLVNGLAQRLFDAVTSFTSGALRPPEPRSDPLTAIVARLNDQNESIRLHAINEVADLGKNRYVEVVDLLASFIRQRAIPAKNGDAPSVDVERALSVLTHLKRPGGTADPHVALPRSSLRSVVLRDGANLEGFDLTGVDLTGADLRGAMLSGADLRGATLNAARLEGTDLEEVRHPEQATFLQAVYDDTTKLPAGIDPSKVGLVRVTSTESNVP